MDKKGTVVIHCNYGLNNQRVYGNHLLTGFGRLGYRVSISGDPKADADLHVCIGPHFAFRDCVGKSTIYLDRCLWGDDMDAVTIGWLNADGGMKYPDECDDSRDKPALKDWVAGDTKKALFLLDYAPYPLHELTEARKSYESLSVRPHPATGKRLPPLIDQLKGNGVAIGYRTSALATALIEGYPVITLDDRSPVASVAGRGILDIRYPNRQQWLNNMSYAQWRGSEIKNGEALEYVINNNSVSSS